MEKKRVTRWICEHWTLSERRAALSLQEYSSCIQCCYRVLDLPPLPLLSPSLQTLNNSLLHLNWKMKSRAVQRSVSCSQVSRLAPLLLDRVLRRRKRVPSSRAFECILIIDERNARPD